MKLVYNETVKANKNKGYTMKKIVSLVSAMLVNAKSFDDFQNAFNALEDDLTKTDFSIFFSTGDDFGFNEEHEMNWYFNVTNTVRGNEKTYDITKEIESLD